MERRLGIIAGVTEMTSASSLGDVRRDIDGAARDVQAAINAARADLPTNLPLNPIYRKINRRYANPRSRLNIKDQDTRSNL
jgi:multidrug efflux pump